MRRVWLIVAVSIAVFFAAGVAGVILAAVEVGTALKNELSPFPVVMWVKDDLSIGITITGCGTTAYISTGELTEIDAKLHDAKASCIVQSTSTGDYLGCLPIPTTIYHNGDTILASSMDRSVQSPDCAPGMK
jgi:hypothetical protein